MSGEDDLADLLGPEPVVKRNGVHTSPAALKHAGGRETLRRSRSYDTHRAIGKLNSPERLKILLKAIAAMPVTSDACMRANISNTTLKYWLQKSLDGKPGDGFDVVLHEDEDPIRFHIAWDHAMVAGVEKVESAAIRKALGQLEPLTFQGRVIYKQCPQALALGLTGADAYLLDDDGQPIPESIIKQDPDLMMFVLKARKPEVYGNKQQIDVNHRGGVLVVSAVAKTGEELTLNESEYHRDRPRVTFEDTGDNEDNT